MAKENAALKGSEASLRKRSRYLHKDIVSTIESNAFTHRLHQVALCLGAIPALLLSACSDNLVPASASLSITPKTHTTTIVEQQDDSGRCLFYPGNHVDIPLVMQLTTNDGSPIGDAVLNVYADFAANTYSGLPVLSLYDDMNGNGVVDEESELLSGEDDAIARVKTGRWTGSRSLLLRVNLSCAFRGEVFAFAGGVTDRAGIEVVAENSTAQTSNEE